MTSPLYPSLCSSRTPPRRAFVASMPIVTLLIATLLMATMLISSASADRSVRYVNAAVFGQSSRSFTTLGDRIVPDSRVAKPDEVIDLRGGFVVPRLTDAHGHLLSLGRALEVIDLRGTTSAAALVTRVSQKAPAAGWIIGRGWDQNQWSEKTFPTHDALSAAFPDRPVALTRVDGHAVFVNAAAMRIAGITRQTRAPEGGNIVRGADGEATGVFVDRAMSLITAQIPEPDAATRERWLLAACAAANAVGLTSVHDMGMDAATLSVLLRLEREGRVPLRVYVYLHGLQPGIGPVAQGLVRVVGVKLFADGALGSRGAALIEPYSDAGHTHGLMQFDDETLRKTLRAVRQAGLQPAIHAIGDHAIRQALDAYAAVEPQRPSAGIAHWGYLPPRLEHAQVIAASDIPRFGALGVIASMQPTHATSDMPWAEARVGSDRIDGAYAWQTLRAAGATLVFGSDFPVESPDPRFGLHAAVTRQDRGGQPAGGWRPNERVSIDDALRYFSSGPAAVVGDPTPWADFTVFARDLRTIPAADIPEVGIQRVVVGGRTVFQAAKE